MADGDIGRVYQDILDVEVNEIILKHYKNKNLMLNLASPESAFNFTNINWVGLVEKNLFLTIILKFIWLY